MITEILEATINEVLLTKKFEISEFQLGQEPYKLLKKETETLITGISFSIYAINHFRGIPVKLHHNDDAIMYCLKVKQEFVDNRG